MSTSRKRVAKPMPQNEALVAEVKKQVRPPSLCLLGLVLRPVLRCL